MGVTVGFGANNPNKPHTPILPNHTHQNEADTPNHSKTGSTKGGDHPNGPNNPNIPHILDNPNASSAVVERDMYGFVKPGD